MVTKIMQFTFTVDEKVASNPEFYRKYANFLESLGDVPAVAPLQKAPTLPSDPVLEILKEATPLVENLAKEFEIPEIVAIWDKFLQALSDASKKTRFDMTSFVKDYLTAIVPELIACGFFVKFASLAVSNPALLAALAKPFTDYF